MSDSDVQQAMQEKLTNAIGRATGGLSDEFASRLSKLREELEELVRSSIAAMPVAEGPSATTGDDAAAAEARVLEAAAAARTLLKAAEAIDRTHSQTQVLAALLEGADTLASRAAVLLTRPDGIQGWGTVGFEEAGPKIEEVHLPYTEGSPWSEMAHARGAVGLTEKEAAPLCDALGTDCPQEAILIPIALADRTAAALYADRLENEDPLDTCGLQILATLAGLTLETLPLRRRGSTPSLRSAEEAAGEAGLPPWDPQGAAAHEQPVPLPSSDEDKASTEKPVAAESVGFDVKGDPDTAYVKRDVVEAAADKADLKTTEKAAEAAKKDDGAATAEKVDTAVSKEADEAAAADGQADTAAGRSKPSRPSASQVAPPPELKGPGAAFSALPEGGADQAQHEDARRLARLLVGEIKLYNEEKLEEGRSKQRILSVLGDEIEQSRQAYDQRVEAVVREASDYFQEEVIRILAGGDQSALRG